MKKYLIYLPSALLVIIAITQIYITQTQGFLTPAKGGGFGMFSTVDKLNNRVLTVYGVFGEDKVKINLDPRDTFYKEQLESKLQRARAFPSYNHLKNLAEALESLHLSQTPQYLYIEVRKCQFFEDGARVNYALVNELTVPYKNQR